MRASDRVRAALDVFLAENRLQGAEITCALSGGADSMTLLDGLLELRSKYALTVRALHIHHGIRGEEADRDASFCRSECARAGVPFEMRRVDVPALAQRERLSMETAARNARYACFEAYCEAYPDAYVATAHTATDNAETVLFRIARGTALRGLCGIPAVRGRYLRPFLSVTSEEIREAAKEKGIPYVVDSSNRDPAYSRNYIRASVMPALESLHAGAVKSIACMTQTLTEDESYLQEQARLLLEQTPRTELRAALASAPSALARRAVRLMYEQVQRSSDALTNRQVVSAIEILRSPRKWASMTLPAGVQMTVSDGEVIFDVHRAEEPSFPVTPVCMGINELPTGGCLIISQEPANPVAYPQMNIYRNLIQSTITFDTIIDTWYVRPKQDGDAYRSGGMTRKLKKLFSDRKLSPAQRRTIPVLCDSSGILWVPGCGVRDCENTKDSKKLFVCYLTEATK